MRNLNCITALASLLVSAAAAAAVPAGTTYSIVQPEQRTRPIANRRCWGIGFSKFPAAGAAGLKTLKETSAAANGSEQFWLYDAQAAVTCRDRQTSNIGRTFALGCWIQSRSATVAIPRNYFHDIPYVSYSLEGAGTLTYTDLAGTLNVVNPGACFIVPTNETEAVKVLVPTAAFKDSSAATYRTSACSSGSGRPCVSNGDCSWDASTCSASYSPTGVYLGFAATSTTVDCSVCEAR